MKVVTGRASILLSALLAVLPSVVSCSSNPSRPQEETPLVPAPTIEYTRPLAYTDLTYRAVIPVDVNTIETKVAAAESTLAVMAEAGVPMREAWVTGRTYSYEDPPGSVVITLRLESAYPAIGDYGFVAPRSFYYLDNETRHYVFRQHAAIPLPAPVMELNDLVGQRDPGVYRLGWWPDGLMYPGTYFMPDAWRAGVESYMRTLLDAGVPIETAWVSANYVDCQWGWRALVVQLPPEASDTLLTRSGFTETGMDASNCVEYRWNYCFEGCPQPATLPEPEQTWVSPDRWRRPSPYDPPWIFYRSIPSQDYGALLGTREQVEAHLREMLRARAPILRAWIPVNPAAADTTNVVVELTRYDWRLWYWGYEETPTGGFETLDWAFVRYYDFSAQEPPPPEPGRPRDKRDRQQAP